MLNWTERIIRMRKEVPEIGWGDFTVIATRDPAILVMRYDWRNNSVLFVHNLDEKPREISFAVGLPGETGKLLVNLLTEDHSRADETRPAYPVARSLRLSLVSGRRARLSAQAQRHRYRCERQGGASGVRLCQVGAALAGRFRSALGTGGSRRRRLTGLVLIDRAQSKA